MDLLDHRLELATQLGAAGTVNAGGGDPIAAFKDLTDGRGADFVFDTTGSSKASAMAPFVAARGGTIVQVGWPEHSSFSYPMEAVIEKELDIHGVNRYCNTFPVAIGLLCSGRIDVSPLISHRYDFSRVVDAFAFATENRSETIKVMILNEDAGSVS
jgi:L-iditol 2-dehydrogenase